MTEPKKARRIQRPFQIGHVVVLRSGGPAMTVRKLGDYGSKIIECDWFFEGNLYSRTFFPEQLKHKARERT